MEKYLEYIDKIVTNSIFINLVSKQFFINVDDKVENNPNIGKCVKDLNYMFGIKIISDEIVDMNYEEFEAHVKKLIKIITKNYLN